MNERTTEARAKAVASWQEFQVSYSYPVYFTDGLFDPDNPTLVDALRRLEPEKRHRCVFFVDDGLTQTLPDLVDRIQHYAAHHAQSMELATAPTLVPGGEKIKSDIHFVEQMQQSLYDHHIDRRDTALL